MIPVQFKTTNKIIPALIKPVRGRDVVPNRCVGAHDLIHDAHNPVLCRASHPTSDGRLAVVGVNKIGRRDPVLLAKKHDGVVVLEQQELRKRYLAPSREHL